MMATFNPKDPMTVNCKTTCEGPGAPKNFPTLGATDDCDWRVYLLKCSPQITGGCYTWYVGCVEASKIWRKMVGHWAGSASDYTAANKPISIELIMPCPTPAAESYLYYAKMEELPWEACKVGRLGGWTQTRPRPSQLCQILLQDDWRMVKGRCLCCGAQDCYVRKPCPKRDQPPTCPLSCGSCSATVHVTALGHVVANKSRGAGAGAGGVSCRGWGSGGGGGGNGNTPPKNNSASSIVSPARVVPTVARSATAQPREFPKVRLCGSDYTMIGWYLGKDAGDKTRQGLRKNRTALANAVEFRHADSKALVTSGFAKPQRAKELMPGRTNLSTVDWLDTACKAARPPHRPLQVKRGHDRSNVLWLVEDLVKHFG